MPAPGTEEGGVPRAVVATASTHFIVDAYTNLYAPLLPLLIPRLGLSLAMAATLATAFQMASSVAQLGFGALADRWRPRVLLVAGPVVAVVLLSFVGSSTSTAMLAALLVAGGLGGAAFHPPAAALVHALSGRRKSLAMALHISGGSLGFSVAPLVFAPAAQALGISWSWLIAIPGLVFLALVLPRLPRIPSDRERGIEGWSALRPYARPLGMLWLVVVLRTFASYSLVTFMPVLLTRQGMSLAAASAIVSLHLFCNSVGGLAGGWLADAYGPKRVMVATLISAVPFLALAPLSTGWHLALLLAVGGFLLQSTLPVNVTYGQQIAPVSAATVSSLMMGFAWGSGALLVPVVGWAADRVGLQRALVTVCLSPLLAAAVAAALPAGIRDQGIRR